MDANDQQSEEAVVEIDGDVAPMIEGLKQYAKIVGQAVYSGALLSSCHYLKRSV
jgi:hypothetical protein